MSTSLQNYTSCDCWYCSGTEHVLALLPTLVEQQLLTPKQKVHIKQFMHSQALLIPRNCNRFADIRHQQRQEQEHCQEQQSNYLLFSALECYHSNGNKRELAESLLIFTNYAQHNQTDSDDEEDVACETPHSGVLVWAFRFFVTQFLSRMFQYDKQTVHSISRRNESLRHGIQLPSQLARLRKVFLIIYQSLEYAEETLFEVALYRYLVP
jgi:hypothetical protein